ncbi:plasmid mobilization protein [Streptomyces sp. ECR2.10]|uniref:plasmid mobilization protein n=1 Tax=Streptomyces sp. ECR2.10 TaxID=3461012 RepID=UPI00404282E0
MAKKQINVRVDEDVYATIEERAKAAGMDVSDYARQVLVDEGNDLRHRFLGAAAHFAQEWGPHFAERFGHPAPTEGDAHGRAA